MLEEILLYTSVLFSGVIVGVHIVCAVAILLNRLRDALQKTKSITSVPYTVSVIVVAKDEEDNLPPLLSSLETQTLQDFETVLASDRSQDKTLAIMQAYRKKHGSRV